MDGIERPTPLKPLTPVSGIPLITRTMRSLEVAGCDKIIIVLGWEAKALERAIRFNYQGPLEVEFVLNDRYDLKNGISVLSAAPHVDGEFILTMSDHILDPKIMHLIRESRPSRGGAALCVDYKLDSILDMDDATKVFVEKGLIRAIGKELKEYNCIDTGVFIGTPVLMEAIEGIYKNSGDASLSQGVQVLAEAGRMEAINIGDAYWQDVDTPEMLSYAEKMLNHYNVEK